MKKTCLLVILSGLIISVMACARLESPNLEKAPKPSEIEEEVDIVDIKVTEGGVKYIVHPSKIIGGGPPKDGIPSIDYPKFVSLKEADQWIEDDELVLAIIYKGVKRVYPLQIMVWHEIVNDTIAGDALLITY